MYLKYTKVNLTRVMSPLWVEWKGTKIKYSDCLKLQTWLLKENISFLYILAILLNIISIIIIIISSSSSSSSSNAN